MLSRTAPKLIILREKKIRIVSDKTKGRDVCEIEISILKLFSHKILSYFLLFEIQTPSPTHDKITTNVNKMSKCHNIPRNQAGVL